MRKNLFIPFILFLSFVFLLYLFRDVILFWAFQKLLSEKDISLKAETLKIEDGKIYFSGLSVRGKDFYLNAQEAEFALSFKERGVKIYLNKFNGGNAFTAGDGTSSLPIYVASLSLKQGTWHLLGQKETVIRLSQAEIKGLGQFLKNFTSEKKLSLSLPLPNQKADSDKVRYGFEELKDAITLALKVDFSKLPSWLHKEEINTGVLRVRLSTSFSRDGKAYFKGLAILKDFGISDYKLPLSGETSFKGVWSYDTYAFSLNGQGSFTPSLKISYNLSGNTRDKPFLRKLFAEINAKDAFFSEIAAIFRAKAKGNIKATISTENSFKEASLEFSLREFGFELSPDEVADGLKIRGKIAFNFEKPLASSGKILLDKGEFYFAPWYYELKKPLALTFKTELSDKSLRFQEIEITGPLYAKVIGLEVYPQVKLPEKSKVVLRVEDFFRPLVVEAYGEEMPWLKELDLKGKLTFSQQKDTIETNYKGNISYGVHVLKNVAIKGRYSLSGKCNPVYFSWQEVKGPLIFAGPLTVHGKLCPPKALIAPFSLALLNGKVSVGGGEANLETKDFVLERVSVSGVKPLLPKPYKLLNPEISGDFARLTFRNDKLQARGGLKIKVAKGEVICRGIFFESGLLPRYGGNLEFYGLDLAILSKTLGLGLITGRLKGEVKNLVMVGKLPDSFELRLEDDLTWRGKRRISLKAVRQMAELGGGSASIFVPFVKNLRYERLGFSCKLKNDVFRLKGLFHKNGKEYLIKGPRLFGVDVVNQNPGGIISFKEMVKRIENILGGQDERLR